MPTLIEELTTLVAHTDADAEAVDDNFELLAKAIEALRGQSWYTPCLVPGEEARTNIAYGTMPTPDLVPNVVLENGGVIAVIYDALWKETVRGAARAAIHLDGTQVDVRVANVEGVTTPQAARTMAETREGGVNLWTPLGTIPIGLGSSHTGSGQNASNAASTGTAVGGLDQAAFEAGTAAYYHDDVVGGMALFWAAAGEYDVDVRYKASSGSVKVKERRLLVGSLGTNPA